MEWDFFYHILNKKCIKHTYENGDSMDFYRVKDQHI